MPLGFDSVDNFWAVGPATGALRPTLDLMVAAGITELKARVRARLAADGQGRIIYGACANALMGQVSKSP